MYKINEYESESKFWRQNSSFFHGNKIEFMKEQIFITQNTKKNYKI